MKKPTMNRILLGLIQHLTAVIAALTLASLLSALWLTSDWGSIAQIRINPLEGVERFEDSAPFHTVMRRSFDEVLRLAVIRSQMETDGVFDGRKKIDVTGYANRKTPENKEDISAYYYLEDLIRWGKYGIEYTPVVVSKEELVYYWGMDKLTPEQFELDEEGDLVFKGFEADARQETLAVTIKPSSEYYDLSIESIYTVNDSSYDSLLEAQRDYIYADYMRSGRLTELVYDYIVNQANMEFTPTLEEDGTVSVYFEMLKCRYKTDDGIAKLTDLVDNWIDYRVLEKNLIQTIEGLSLNYDEYQGLSRTYSEDNTNLRYLIRCPKNGYDQDYTNVSGLAKLPEDELNQIFQAYGSYAVCSPGTMKFEGNIELNEELVYHTLQEYSYIYPENTRIWIGVDLEYPVAGDTFAIGHNAFEGIIPRFSQIVIFVAALAAVWLGIWLYLSVTAGWAVDEEGKRVRYVNGFDRIWTEFALLMAAAVTFVGYLGILALLWAFNDSVFLREISGSSRLSGSSLMLCGLYGFMASLTFSAFWYSLIRRIKSRSLWKNSFLHWLWTRAAEGLGSVVSHGSISVRTLVPYGIFLAVNVIGALFALNFRYKMIMLLLTCAATILFDVAVGVLLFRKNAEQQEIVRGINKIREGDVEYQLDSEKLHGENRALAEAVNNIGDGIRRAVETSMKDERMKADLITNVSHDIKTPLTSIINYVDLLKREKITQEPAKSYIEVLEGKSQRLKQLTDDLVEASKISSGNIIMEKEKLNLIELLNQTIGEFSERLAQNGLQVIFETREREAYIYADSRRMWRIIENLFNNICKYAMPGTRVYLDLFAENGKIETSVKNISRLQLNNISPEELTERFVRGDASRTTEGSGLGLSIAKSLTKAQGGEFVIYLDGDLFKVTVSFPVYEEAPAREEEPDPVEEKPDRKRRRLRKSKKSRVKKAPPQDAGSPEAGADTAGMEIAEELTALGKEGASAGMEIAGEPAENSAESSGLEEAGGPDEAPDRL